MLKPPDLVGMERALLCSLHARHASFHSRPTSCAELLPSCAELLLTAPKPLWCNEINSATIADELLSLRRWAVQIKNRKPVAIFPYAVAAGILVVVGNQFSPQKVFNGDPYAFLWHFTIFFNGGLGYWLDLPA